MMRLYIDFKSPAACLAMKPTFALAQRLGQTLDILPFKTRQVPIPAQKPDETKGETHRRVRALARRDTHLKYARLQGTPMVFGEEHTECDVALAALLFAREAPKKFITAAFASWWDGSGDLNDPDFVRGLLTNAGHDASAFDADKCLEELARVHQEAEEAGVIDAPAYIIDDQLFIGREHLPWIETLMASASSGTDHGDA